MPCDIIVERIAGAAQSSHQLRAESFFETVNKYLVNSIFSYDCPNAILVDFKYSRVATGHRGSK